MEMNKKPDDSLHALSINHSKNIYADHTEEMCKGENNYTGCPWAEINLSVCLQRDCEDLKVIDLKVDWTTTFKGALNPNFLNLTINREKFCLKNALVPSFVKKL